jgi:hypothetical protein
LRERVLVQRLVRAAGTWPADLVRCGRLHPRRGRGAAILRGVNVSGENKHAPWFGFHQAQDFARVRDAWGMNAARFLVLWAALEPSTG